MNERVLELAIEARKYAETKPDIYQVAYDKKFAESIVKECVIQCEREWIRHGTDSIHNQAIHGCINSIKEHFGVKGLL